MLAHVAPESAPLRNIEVVAQFQPDLAQVSPVVEKLPGRAPTGGQDVGMDEKPSLGPPELVLEELMEFRQSHASMIPAELSTALPHP